MVSFVHAIGVIAIIKRQRFQIKACDRLCKRVVFTSIFDTFDFIRHMDFFDDEGCEEEPYINEDTEPDIAEDEDDQEDEE